MLLFIFLDSLLGVCVSLSPSQMNCVIPQTNWFILLEVTIWIQRSMQAKAEQMECAELGPVCAHGLWEVTLSSPPSLSLLLLSVSLSVLIPLAPLKFSFSHSPCLAQSLKGNCCRSHCFPSSLISVLHSSAPFLLFERLLPPPPPPILPAFASVRLTRVCAKYCPFMQQDGLSSAHTAAGSPKSKYHIML